MGMDIDYIAGKQAIEKLDDFFGDLQHGKRGKVADDIIKMVDEIIKKYKKK